MGVWKAMLEGITSNVSGNDLNVRIKMDNKAMEGIMPPAGGMPGGPRR
jgi:hypothetical protein